MGEFAVKGLPVIPVLPSIFRTPIVAELTGIFNNTRQRQKKAGSKLLASKTVSKVASTIFGDST